MPKETFFNLPEDKRNHIVDLAIEEFAENDYIQASISRLVARAGIAKGSFYQYFEDKKDLYMYLLDLASQEKMALLKNARPPDPQMGLFDYLRWLFRGTIRFQFTRPLLAQMAYRAVYGDTPLKSEIFRRLGSNANAYYLQLIERGITTGEIDPGIDRDLAAFLLGAVFNEFGKYLTERLNIDPHTLLDNELQSQDYEAMYTVADRLLDILEHGLGRRKPAAADRLPSADMST